MCIRDRYNKNIFEGLSPAFSSFQAFPSALPRTYLHFPIILEESESSKDSLPLQPSKEIKSKCKRPCKDNRSPRKKKKVEKTTFNIDNIVSTTSASPVLLDVGSRRTIAIPEFREVGDSFYRVEMSVRVSSERLGAGGGCLGCTVCGNT
eukprot:TRINITY_DN1749_c0_g2_i9.p1 TRINITY_DN1749_c0_g2~~TRINITY_DN1749_c0_g2_i9.p1  ORF type:complete len:149 (-),score=9.78 TRINITY_DN1749_c0_g2_i9:209-655(-)